MEEAKEELQKYAKSFQTLLIYYGSLHGFGSLPQKCWDRDLRYAFEMENNFFDLTEISNQCPTKAILEEGYNHLIDICDERTGVKKNRGQIQ